MKDYKQLRQGPAESLAVRPAATDKNGAADMAEQKSSRSPVTGHKPLGPGSTMQGDVQLRRSRGRLSRESLVKLGKVLETYFDNVRREGVPDRFKRLLEQYEERRSQDQQDPSAQYGERKDTGQPLREFQEGKDKGTR